MYKTGKRTKRSGKKSSKKELSEQRKVFVQDLFKTIESAKEGIQNLKNFSQQDSVDSDVFNDIIRCVYHDIDELYGLSQKYIYIPGPERDNKAITVSPSFDRIDPYSTEDIYDRDYRVSNYQKLIYYLQKECELFDNIKYELPTEDHERIELMEELTSKIVPVFNTVNEYLSWSNYNSVYMQQQYINLMYPNYFYQGRIQNIIRIRPKLLNKKETDVTSVIKDTTIVKCGDKEINANFVVNQFGLQSDISQLLEPYVELGINGGSGLILATGPRQSGKTYTMMGPNRDLGVIPNILLEIYERGKTKEGFQMRLFTHIIKANTEIKPLRPKKKSKKPESDRSIISTKDDLIVKLCSCNKTRPDKTDLIVECEIIVGNNTNLKKTSNLIFIDPASINYPELSNSLKNLNKSKLQTTMILESLNKILSLDGLITIMHCIPPAMTPENIETTKSVLSTLMEMKTKPISYQVEILEGTEQSLDVLRFNYIETCKKCREMDRTLEESKKKLELLVSEQNSSTIKLEREINAFVSEENKNDIKTMELNRITQEYQYILNVTNFLEKKLVDLKTCIENEKKKDVESMDKKEEISQRKVIARQQREDLEREYFRLRNLIEKQKQTKPQKPVLEARDSQRKTMANEPKRRVPSMAPAKSKSQIRVNRNVQKL